MPTVAVASVDVGGCGVDDFIVLGFFFEILDHYKGVLLENVVDFLSLE